MKPIDISLTISPDTPVYPGDPRPGIESFSSIEYDGFCVSRIVLGSHTGTHIDAPSHILKEGKAVHEISLEKLIGSAVVLDLSSKNNPITGKDLEAAFRNFVSTGADILLIRTGTVWSNLSDPGPEKLLSLDVTAGQWIIENGFRTVGIDGFSVDSPSSSSVHEMLLVNGVNIVECLDLAEVVEGNYFFVCLPLKIKDCDGAPARAVLFPENPFL